VLESFNLSQEDAEMLILQARVAAGWIDASELPQQPEPEYEEGDYTDEVFGDGEAVEGDVTEESEGLEHADLENGDAEVFAEDLEKSRDS
jgi:transcription termination/antitermination protein NusA